MFYEPSQIQFNLSPRFEARISNIYSTFRSFLFGEIPEWLSIFFLLPTETFLEGNAPFGSFFPASRIDICCFISFHQFPMFNGSLRTRNLFLSSHSNPGEAFVQKIAREWRQRQFNGFFREKAMSFGPRKGIRDTPSWGKQQSNWISWKTPSRLIERVLELWFDF